MLSCCTKSNRILMMQIKFSICLRIQWNVSFSSKYFMFDDLFWSFLVSLMISKAEEKNSTIVSQKNLDLYPLCTAHLQNHQIELLFEAETCSDENIQSFHKMLIDVEISSDQPILKKMHKNCLYVTIDSICNLEMESSTIAFGLKAPLESEVKAKFHSLKSEEFQSFVFFLHI
jgi:hypothetical protein